VLARESPTHAQIKWCNVAESQVRLLVDFHCTRILALNSG
jgi:hypothetical protein